MADLTKIFEYEIDGVKYYADPMDILACLWQSLPNIGELQAATKSEDKMKSLDAQAQLSEAARDVFGLPEFDTTTGKGWPKGKCLAVLWSSLTRS